MFVCDKAKAQATTNNRDVSNGEQEYEGELSGARGAREERGRLETKRGDPGWGGTERKVRERGAN